MGHVLIVAEKPSVAREIAAFLGAKKKSKQGKYLEGNQYIVTWLLGHILSLADPQDYDPDLKKWKPETLPIVPSKFKYKVREIKGKKDPKAAEQYRTIKDLFDRSDVSEVICATDPGAEGELIFQELYHHCRCKKPLKRLWLKSLTEEGIRDAFSNLRDSKEFYGLYQSALCRSKADWLTGINLSRAYSIKFNDRLSIGRVQTPTLAMIVGRELTIQSFIPESYSTLEANLGFGNVLFVEQEGHGEHLERISRQRAEEIKSKLQGGTLLLDSLNVEKCSEGPPRLYDLDSLQADASAQLSMTAEETLQAAQFLYERKLISYPRTDCTYLSTKDISIIPDILRSIKQKMEFKSFIDEIEQKSMSINPKFIDDSKITEHSAIIPTTIGQKGGINSKYVSLYDLILRRFISAFYEPYKYTRISGVFKSEEDIHGTFAYMSNHVEYSGWKKVYGDVDKNTPPDLKEGEKYNINYIEIKDKKTKPPSRYTDGTLVQAMKNCGRNVEDTEARRLMGEGIGTPATRAGIIETLILKNYIQRVGKAIYATPKGIELIQIIENENLKSPSLTGEWEKKRSKIQDGSYDPDVFVSEIVIMVRDVISSLFPDMELQADLISGSRKENGGAAEAKEGKKSVVLTISRPDSSKNATESGLKKEVTLSIIRKVL